MENSPQRTTGDDIREGVNIVCLVAMVHAHCVYPFVRIGYGLEVPGFLGVLAVVMMIFVGLAAEDVAILRFMVIWLAATLVQRLIAIGRYFLGYRVHTLYEGFPWLGNLFALGRGGVTAKVFEVGVVFFLGTLLATRWERLGLFVISSSCSLLFVLLISEFAKWRRVSKMVDMEIEQRALAERVRRYRDGL